MAEFRVQPVFVVFPARAGVILAYRHEYLGEVSLSRTSGGDPLIVFTPRIDIESFPHERG